MRDMAKYVKLKIWINLSTKEICFLKKHKCNA